MTDGYYTLCLLEWSHSKWRFAMQAVEFVSKAHDGVVDLPREYRGWNGKTVRVILQEAVSEVAKRKAQFNAATISTRGFRFDRDAANER
jgi:hypothetical protein